MAGVMRRRRDEVASSADILLNTTSALMTERNSVDVTFADIAERSGLNSALIRYHFGSKTGLFKALLERDIGGNVVDLEALVAADMPAAQKLRHHVSGIIKIYFRYPYLNRLVGALSLDAESEMARFIAERFTRPLARAQAAILDQGEREGSFRRIDPTLFYFSLIGASDHLFHARHSLRYAFGITEISDALRRSYAAHITELLLEGVRIKPER